MVLHLHRWLAVTAARFVPPLAHAMCVSLAFGCVDKVARTSPADASASNATDPAVDIDAPESVGCATPQDCAHITLDAGPVVSCCINKVCIYGPAVIDAVPCTDADVQLIVASSYDQSCQIDSDCVPVAEGNFCIPSAGVCPSAAAINKSAYSRYQADVAKTNASLCQAVGGCGIEFVACCRRGLCQNGLECSNSASLTDGGAGADSGDGSPE